jgi:hypothetical protein
LEKKNGIVDQVDTLLPNGQHIKEYEPCQDNSAPSDSIQHNGHEGKNGGRKSPLKSPRKGPIKSPTKGYKSPTKRLAPAEASTDSTKPELLTTKKDKSGGRAIETNIRSGNAGSASSSHISAKHNVKSDRADSSHISTKPNVKSDKQASTGQWWKVRHQ